MSDKEFTQGTNTELKDSEFIHAAVRKEIEDHIAERNNNKLREAFRHDKNMETVVLKVADIVQYLYKTQLSDKEITARLVAKGFMLGIEYINTSAFMSI